MQNITTDILDNSTEMQKEEKREKRQKISNDYQDFSTLLSFLSAWRVEFFSEELLNELLKFTINEIKPNNEDDYEILCCRKILDFISLYNEENRDNGKKEQLMHKAAEHGYLDIIVYCNNNGYPISEVTIFKAILNGRLEILKYFHSLGCSWPRFSCFFACSANHLECLKFLHQTGACLTTDVYQYAVKNLKMLEYILENDSSLSETFCYYAAGERIESLIMLREAGCPWDEMTIQAAITENKPDCLKYAIKNNCPVTSYYCRLAAHNGRTECLSILINAGLLNENILEYCTNEECISLCQEYYSSFSNCSI